MADESEEKGIYTFSHTRGHIFIVNHLGTFLISTILIIIIAVYKGNLDRIVTIYAILFLCTLYYVVEKLLKKNAYKIIIDFGSRQIQFYMNRTGDIVTSNFDDIKDISINFHITFLLGEKKILYNDLQNKELLRLLNRIRTRLTGLTGSHLKY